MYGLVGIEKGDKPRMRAQYLRNFTFFDSPVGVFFTYGRDLGMGALLDLGMFIQTVMVAARGHGLHTCPQQCWLQFHKVVAKHLDIPEGETLACDLALGYADEDAVINSLESERERIKSFRCRVAKRSRRRSSVGRNALGVRGVYLQRARRPIPRPLDGQQSRRCGAGCRLP